MTYSQLEECIDKALNKHLKKHFEGTITALQASIDAVNKIADNARSLAEKLEARVKVLEEENKNLKKDTAKIEQDLSKRITDLEEKLEERTNWQHRKTLVIRGIPDKPRDQPAETWEGSRVNVAKAIAKVCPEIGQDKAYTMVERAHRSSHKTNYQGKAPRPIFAAFTFWPDTVTITDAFRKRNIEDRNFGVSVDYKYGPKTTKRRSLAMQERKKMKEKGEIVSAYVAYPARLMVKTSKQPGAKYTLAKDFSKVNVEIGKKD